MNEEQIQQLTLRVLSMAQEVATLRSDLESLRRELLAGASSPPESSRSLEELLQLSQANGISLELIQDMFGRSTPVPVDWPTPEDPEPISRLRYERDLGV